jgi:hypothetical protein
LVIEPIRLAFEVDCPVTIWEPPTRLGYTWHLNRDRSDATDVEIRFVASGGWATLLPHFVAASSIHLA